jgi:hypothetical protein
MDFGVSKVPVATATEQMRGFFDRLWRSIGFGTQPQTTGQQRPYQFELGHEDSLQARYFDLEIPFLGAVRDSQRASELHEMRELCSEVGTSINMLCDDALSHLSGDAGIAVKDFVDDAKQVPIDPATKVIVQSFLYEKATPSEIRPWIDEYLSTGDCFVELVYESDMSGIRGFLHLPVWELFRVESNSGQLLGFEQRRNLSAEGRSFHPIQIAHFRYQRQKLYGRSLFEELRADWQGLKSAEEDWARACRELGTNPLVHYMPPCADEAYRKKYTTMHKARMALGTINHYYLDAEAKIANATTMQPNLQFLFDRVDQKRRKFFQRARIPPWLVGIAQNGAKEIAGLPGESFARHINSIRQTLTDGLAYALEIELALNGITGDRARFRLSYPEIIVNPYAQPNDGQSNL